MMTGSSLAEKSNNRNDALLRSDLVTQKIGLTCVVGATIAYGVQNGGEGWVRVEARVGNLEADCCWSYENKKRKWYY